MPGKRRDEEEDESEDEEEEEFDEEDDRSSCSSKRGPDEENKLSDGENAIAAAVFEQERNHFLAGVPSDFEDEDEFEDDAVASNSPEDSPYEEEEKEEELPLPDEEAKGDDPACPSPESPSRKRRRKRLLLHVGFTQYDVVKEVGRMLNFRITTNEDLEWDLMWLDGGVTPDRLLKMKNYQRANHFPGMYALARKNFLGRNLMKMLRQYPTEYNFFPKTWCLPAEYADFKQNFERAGGRSHKAYILKPEALSQGKGIFITKSLSEVDPNEHFVAQ